MAAVNWDIFCSVVDNYGDIGVTWRLARQLVAEHQLPVRLWVDDLAAFAQVCPSADAAQTQQWQQGVEVRYWPAEWPPGEAAAVVIEAFACKLPDAYRVAMKARLKPSLWLNLEYLSAESWVDGCHGLPSPQLGGQKKFFFFPGFTPGTGGLLREEGLIERRRAFQQHATARTDFLSRFGISVAPSARLFSVFAYENPAVGSWLQALADDSVPTHLLVPEGRILPDVNAWLGDEELSPGSIRQQGSLTVQALPFVSQEDYDRLLWSCDFNLVRGEDSFVRAQWSGKPMLWHIYVQAEDAHLEKLDAFLQRYCQSLSAGARRAVNEFWHAWNEVHDLGPAWRNMLEHWPELADHAERWCDEKAAQADLAAALVQVYGNWI